RGSVVPRVIAMDLKRSSSVRIVPHGVQGQHVRSRLDAIPWRSDLVAPVRNGPQVLAPFHGWVVATVSVARIAGCHDAAVASETTRALLISPRHPKPPASSVCKGGATQGVALRAHPRYTALLNWRFVYVAFQFRSSFGFSGSRLWQDVRGSVGCDRRRFA